MKIQLSAFLMILAMALVACGGGEKKKTEEDPETSNEPKKSGRSMVVEEIGLLHPESVISDGEFFYVSNLGEELAPSEKDGDGFIMKLSWDSVEVVEADFITGLDAPKGMAILDGKLYVADVDKVKAFDLATKEMVAEADFSSKGTAYLNDIAIQNQSKLFVSATDIGKIYELDLDDMSYEEVETRPSLIGPNGLWYDAPNNDLYVAGFPLAGPTGNVGVIDFVPGQTSEYRKLHGFEGLLDGIAVAGELVFFSDWNRQVLLVLNTTSGQLGTYPIPSGSMAGPADFYWDQKNGEFWIPVMQENKIVIQTL